MIITPTANAVSVTAASTINSAPLLMVNNDTAAAITLTHYGANTNIFVGTISVPAQSTIYLKKAATDMIGAGSAISVTPIRIISM